MSPGQKSARLYLITGNHFPHDADNAWWNDDRTRGVPPAKDWAHKAARGILAKLKDQRDCAGLNAMGDEAARVEIVEDIAEIIRIALEDYAAQTQVRHE